MLDENNYSRLTLLARGVAFSARFPLPVLLLGRALAAFLLLVVVTNRHAAADAWLFAADCSPSECAPVDISVKRLAGKANLQLLYAVRRVGPVSR